MADDVTPETKALQAQVADLTARLEATDAKYTKAMDDLKDTQRKLRATSEITPEALQAAEDRADKAEAKLAEADKALKAANAERDKAVKAHEVEQGAARSYAINAEIANAIAEGNVVPALVPAFRALVSQGAKADLVDGKYSVMSADGKPVGEAIKAILASEDGKHFVAAPQNGGGGAPGGQGGGQSGAKTMARSAFDGLSPAEKSAFAKEGGKVVDQAA